MQQNVFCQVFPVRLLLIGTVEINIYNKLNFLHYYLFSFLVAVKRIREIMAGADMNLHPPTQPQGMPVSSPVPTPSFNQPLAIFDRQPLPPGVCAIIYKLKAHLHGRKLLVRLGYKKVRVPKN